MKLIRLECPNCGASLQAEQGAETAVCRFCGTAFAVTDDVIRSEHTVNIRDEAKLRETQLNEQRYRDEQDRRALYEAEQKAEKYKRGFAGKFNIVFIILCALAMFSSFANGKILAGIIALLQMILLIVGRLTATNTIKTIRGFRIPPILFTLAAVILAAPFSSLFTRKTYEKLEWPSSGIAEHLPDPVSRYGTVMVNGSSSFSAQADKYSQTQFSEYVRKCMEMGFKEDTEYGYEFEGYNREGYTVSLDYNEKEQSMRIRAEAPLETTELSWPLSDLVQELPAPASLKGVIRTDSNDEVDVLFTGISAAEAQEYMNAVKPTPFGETFSLQDRTLTAADPEGNELTIRAEQFGRMSLRVTRYIEPEETPEPEQTPEASAEPTPEPTAETEPAPEKEPVAAGIRPEFQKNMEDYEAFYDEYIAFMQKYSKSDNPVTMMTDYLSLMSRAEEMERSLDQIDESELSDDEYKLYIDVTTRVTNKLAKASVDMN